MTFKCSNGTFCVDCDSILREDGYIINSIADAYCQDEDRRALVQAGKLPEDAIYFGMCLNCLSDYLNDDCI